MNLQEFAALKEGDKIENAATFNYGEVTKTVKDGVFVVWGTRSAMEREFFYSVQTSAWFQWSVRDDKAEAGGIPGVGSGNS